MQVPIFCTTKYVKYLSKVKSQKVIWYAGFKNDFLIFIIPFTITKKAIFRKGQFLTSSLTLTTQMEL